jgi:folylpolyglutamate synthase/dihydropteroate synthase
MSDRLTPKAARARAAQALLAYLDERTQANETALLDAAHNLEAAVVARRLAKTSQTRDAERLAQVVASH